MFLGSHFSKGNALKTYENLTKEHLADIKVNKDFADNALPYVKYSFTFFRLLQIVLLLASLKYPKVARSFYIVGLICIGCLQFVPVNSVDI